MCRVPGTVMVSFWRVRKDCQVFRIWERASENIVLERAVLEFNPDEYPCKMLGLNRNYYTPGSY